MKFHGIAMVGPFVNQKLTAKPDPFVQDRDQGRLIWLTDGTIWYGSIDEWVNFSAGAGDASEVEDMYSDLLRTTFFLNGSYGDFALAPADDDLVASTTMTHNATEKRYDYTVGQNIESTNLFDSETGLTWVDYVLPSVHFEYDTGTPQIEVTSNGGVDWFLVQNNKVFRIPNEQAGTDLRMRFTGNLGGQLYSWGLIYNKDITASCSKYGLTYAKFEANEGQTVFEVNYSTGAVQVFLNGDLLDASDYDSSSGTEIVFYEPLHAGDIVYILSFSTSILDPNIDWSDFIRRDGSVPFIDDQTMNNHFLTDLPDGINDQDAVNVRQLNAVSLNILKAVAMGTWEGDYHAAYTSNTAELITNIDLSFPDNITPTWTAAIVYTYNTEDLPSLVTYSYNGVVTTQTYVFDTNDLPTSMTQVTV